MSTIQTQQPRPRFEWTLGRCCGMLLLVLFCAWIALIIFQNVTWFAVEFDSEKWKNGSELDRGKMAIHPEFADLLIGRDESELLDLLGQPFVSYN